MCIQRGPSNNDPWRHLAVLFIRTARDDDASSRISSVMLVPSLIPAIVPVMPTERTVCRTDAAGTRHRSGFAHRPLLKW